ncbi:MAG: hypothetical protein HY904_16370 [Deltaproteobacteria bacterium]|nr:hypothetical protein [Deltaproteobacteria bacterium]
MARGRRNVTARKRSSTGAPVATLAPGSPAAAEPLRAASAEVPEGAWRRALEHLGAVEDALARAGGPAPRALATAAAYRARLVELGEAVLVESDAGTLPSLPEAVRARVAAAGELRSARGADNDARPARATQDARTGDVEER